MHQWFERKSLKYKFTAFHHVAVEHVGDLRSLKWAISAACSSCVGFGSIFGIFLGMGEFMP